MINVLDKKTYDKDLQMFKLPPAEFKPNYLGYLRYLAEHDMLEHRPISESLGEYAPDVHDSRD